MSIAILNNSIHLPIKIKFYCDANRLFIGRRLQIDQSLSENRVNVKLNVNCEIDLFPPMIYCYDVNCLVQHCSVIFGGINFNLIVCEIPNKACNAMQCVQFTVLGYAVRLPSYINPPL